MSDKQEEAKKQNVEADDQSIAIGSIDVGGDVSGNITIGHTIGYTADEVSALIEQISTTFQPKQFDGRCPYMGLDVFEEEDTELFFGREKIVDELVERVKESRTVFITGPSGNGKSSLVRAGLIPALKLGGLKNSERWLYEKVKPGRDPLEALALAFSRLKSPELGKYFRENINQSNVLHECAESALSGQRDQRLVLFIDQFEEVFTQVSNEDERAVFLDLLTNAATVENGRVIILFAMRSDFVSNCATYPQLNVLLNKQFVQIGAMGPDELVSAIAQPALRVGLRIDPDLIAQIINDMQGEPGALPLMQFALKDLFEAEQTKGGVISLTREAYLGRGGIQKSLERHADASFSKLEKHEQELARSIFGGLIEIGRGTQDTRRTALFDELTPANASAGEIEAIVRKLADARLITTDELAGKDLVTISHEKLIDAWPWLKRLVDENRDAIALQNQITTDAKEWEDKNRDPSYLYIGARLANAHEQLEAKKFVLSGLAQEFVQASFEVQEQGQRAKDRLRWRITAGLAVATLILAALSIIAFASYRVAERERETAIIAESDAQTARSAAEQQQRIATIRQWSAQSLSYKEKLPQRSLLLAKEAISRTIQHELSIPEAEEALRQVLTTAGGIPFQRHESAIYTVTFSPDGEYVLTVDSGGEAKLSRVGDPIAQPLAFSVAKMRAEDATFSPDGRLLIAAAYENDQLFLEVWNISEQSEQRYALSGNYIKEIHFSPDGQYLITTVTGDQHGEQLWKVSGSALSPLKLPKHELILSRIAFSPRGNYLFTTGRDGRDNIWSVKDLSVPLMTFPKSGEGRSSPTFSPDDHFLINWKEGLLGAAQLWNVDNLSIPPVDLSIQNDEILSVIFSPDEKYVVLFVVDGILGWETTARVWKTTTGEEVTQMFTEGEQPLVTFSPDGHYFITHYKNGVFARNTANLFAPAINLSENMKDIYDITSSPDGRYLAIVDNHASLVRVWTTDNLAVPLVELNGYKQGSFSPDSRFLILKDNSGLLYLWIVDYPTKTPILLRDSDLNIRNLSFSSDGRFIVATSNNLLYLWQMDNFAAPTFEGQEQEPVVLHGHEKTIERVAFSPNSRYLVTGDNGGDVRLWGLDGFFMWASMLNNDSKRVHDIIFSSDNQYILALQNDGSALLWYASDPTSPATMLVGHDGVITSAEFSFNGHFLITRDNSYQSRVWQIENLTVTPVKLGRTEYDLDHARFSLNGNFLILHHFSRLPSDDPSTYFWDLRHPSAGLAAPQENILPCCIRTFSPDEQYAVRETRGSVHLHSINNLEAPATPLITYPLNDSNAYVAATFSPDGRYLLTQLVDPPNYENSASFTSWEDVDETAHLWNMNDLSVPPAIVSRVVHESSSEMLFSSSGRKMATIDVGGVVWLWDLNDPSNKQTALRGSPKGVTVMNFSPDERYFVMGGNDGAVRLWDMEKLDSAPTVLLSHEGPVTKITFSPDQRTLLVGHTRNNIVRFWDMDELDAAPSLMRDVSEAAFSPDGHYVMIRSESSGVRLMSRKVSELMDLACVIAARNLSWDEWQQFMGDVPYNRTCPNLPPHPTVAPALIALGEEYAWQGNIEKAHSAFQEAQRVDPSFTIPASSWNDLCWFGGLASRAIDVLDACTKAVEMEPENGKYRDSRGLVRALSNDFAGAIEDLEFVVSWAHENEFTEKALERQSWLDALNAGQNPFSPEVLADLRLE